MYFDVTYFKQLFIIAITISYKDFQVKVIFTCENLYGDKEEDGAGKTFDILPGLKAEDSRIRLYSYSEPLQILFADAAEMFATSPIHGLMLTAWFLSRQTG